MAKPYGQSGNGGFDLCQLGQLVFSGEDSLGGGIKVGLFGLPFVCPR
jgi:hypothetical protein